MTREEFCIAFHLGLEWRRCTWGRDESVWFDRRYDDLVRKSGHVASIPAAWQHVTEAMQHPDSFELVHETDAQTVRAHVEALDVLERMVWRHCHQRGEVNAPIQSRGSPEHARAILLLIWAGCLAQVGPQCGNMIAAEPVSERL